MSRYERENCVTFYKTGVASVAVHFPNGDTVCRWCPFIRYDEPFKRCRCLLTGEYLPYPMESMGVQCPVNFEKEDEKYEFDS